MRLVAVGTVESPLTDRGSAPKQADEGAPSARLVFAPEMAGALDGIAVGDELLVLTWLDRAQRDVLRVHPRGDPNRSQQGVREVVYRRSTALATRSIRIARSTLDDRAGVIGAAVMVIEAVLAPDAVDQAIAAAG